MTPADYTTLSAVEIARLVAARKVTAREITAAALARIEASEPRANAFIYVDGDGARGAADALDTALAAGDIAGPLAGVPVSVKDLVHVAGMPTTFGSAAVMAQPATDDAVPVARLRAAGAIIVGKTTTPEFGHKAITASPLFGETPNPWNRDYTCGGSSGGAGVSLAVRQVPLAVGTDGGGSIRIPASACGVFGLKATQGRVPHIHAADLFGNNSFIGPMARTASDLELMYRVMAGPDERDPWSKVLADAEVRPIRKLGFTLSVGNPAVDAEVAASVEAAVNCVVENGIELVPVHLDFCRFEALFRASLEAALAGRVALRADADRARFDPTFAKTITSGLARTGAEVAQAAVARSELFRLVESTFADIDALATPTLATASIARDTDVHADIVIDGINAGPIRAGWYPYTFPFNLTGHPALSLPCGWTSEGLPVGLQVAGPWYSEPRLLGLAATLQDVLHVEMHEPDA